MSNIFDALKKVHSKQVEQLFGNSEPAENTKRKAHYYPLPQTRENNFDLVQLESSPEVVNFTPSKPGSTLIVSPPIQTASTSEVEKSIAIVGEDLGKQVVLNNMPASESFSLLAAKLLVISRNQDLHSICITSSVANEGKTFVATNLALALSAESERGVIVIDGNLRKPSVRTVQGAIGVSGLAGFLQSDCTEIDSLIVHTKHLSAFIPAGSGPNNPLPLLNSEKMKWLMGELRNRYDFVIIDAPSTATLADTESLASLTDGLILVIRAEQTPLSLAQQSLKLLSKHTILGTVLNGTAAASSY
ncbi:MAG: CpsD/CapB family tyrosine-protein kinase [Acidobacteriota bacterium]